MHFANSTCTCPSKTCHWAQWMTTIWPWHLKFMLVISMIISPTTAYNDRSEYEQDASLTSRKDQRRTTTAVMQHLLNGNSSSRCCGFCRASLMQNWAAYYISQHSVIFHERRRIESYLLDLLFEWVNSALVTLEIQLLRCANLHCLGKAVLIGV